MATFKILGKNGTTVSLFADADTARLPAIVDTTAGALTLSADVTIPAGKTLGTTGSGTINLPNNGSSTFKVEGVAVSANVTAANLATLTGGGNADSLHTHTAVQASSLDLAGLTLFATPVVGEVAYISANNTVARAKADAGSTSGAVGAYAGTAATILIGGKISLLFDAGLTLTAGDKVFLSAATAGRVTNVAPSTSTNIEYELGRLLDSTGYVIGTGTAQPCVWAPKVPITV